MTGYGYDWRYSGYVSVTVQGHGTFTSPTICNWRRHWTNAIDAWLGCYIECDGGGVEMARVAGQRALSVIWKSGEHLRMSSCGGGGVILRGGETTKVFRLKAVPQAECKQGLD